MLLPVLLVFLFSVRSKDDDMTFYGKWKNMNSVINQELPGDTTAHDTYPPSCHKCKLSYLDETTSIYTVVQAEGTFFLYSYSLLAQSVWSRSAISGGTMTDANYDRWVFFKFNTLTYIHIVPEFFLPLSTLSWKKLGPLPAISAGIDSFNMIGRSIFRGKSPDLFIATPDKDQDRYLLCILHNADEYYNCESRWTADTGGGVPRHISLWWTDFRSSRNHLWRYGGASYDTSYDPCNDLAALSLESGMWERVFDGNNCGWPATTEWFGDDSRPGSRVHSTGIGNSLLFGDSVFFFAGSGCDETTYCMGHDNSHLSDLWRLHLYPSDFSSYEFHLANLSGYETQTDVYPCFSCPEPYPGSKEYHGTVIVPASLGVHFYSYGGKDCYGDVRGDLWRFYYGSGEDDEGGSSGEDDEGGSSGDGNDDNNSNQSGIIVGGVLGGIAGVGFLIVVIIIICCVIGCYVTRRKKAVNNNWNGEEQWMEKGGGNEAELTTVKTPSTSIAKSTLKQQSPKKQQSVESGMTKMTKIVPVHTLVQNGVQPPPHLDEQQAIGYRSAYSSPETPATLRQVQESSPPISKIPVFEAPPPSLTTTFPPPMKTHPSNAPMFALHPGQFAGTNDAAAPKRLRRFVGSDESKFDFLLDEDPPAFRFGYPSISYVPGKDFDEVELDEATGEVLFLAASDDEMEEHQYFDVVVQFAVRQDEVDEFMKCVNEICGNVEE